MLKVKHKILENMNKKESRSSNINMLKIKGKALKIQLSR